MPIPPGQQAVGRANPPTPGQAHPVPVEGVLEARIREIAREEIAKWLTGTPWGPIEFRREDR